MLTSRSLRSQITLLFAGLILLTVISLLITYWFRTSTFNQMHIDNQFMSAENVLEGYLEAKERLLVTAARVLTADFGFKQAVGTQDRETIASALLNHGQRIDADLMVLVSLDGELLSVSPRELSSNKLLTVQMLSLPLRSEHSQFMFVDSSIYQVIILPIKAPRTIAYSIVGFEIDAVELEEMKALTGLDISIVDQRGNPKLSTFRESSILQAAMDATIVRDENKMFFLQQDYQHHRVKLETLEGEEVILSASLIEENQQFERLLLFVFLVGGGIIIVAVVLSQFLVQRVTQPLQHLIAMTKSIAQGNFDIKPSRREAATEFGELNNAFLTMGREIESRQNEIAYQAQHDLITGLLNRHTLLERLDQTLEMKVPLLMIGVNIRHFKQINNTVGPTTGDVLLEKMGDRLQHFLGDYRDYPEQVFASRISADDFLIVVPHRDGMSPEEVVTLLQDRLERPYQLGDFELTIRCFISFLTTGNERVPARDLLRRINIAMTAAKEEKQVIRPYRDGEEEEYLRRIRLVEKLKIALEADDEQLFLNYQPKLNLHNNSIDKVEVLMRWIDKDEGFISPELFIALAEQTGLIVTLTHWVINKSLAQMAAWSAEGYELSVSINISAEDIAHADFIEFLLGRMKAYKVSPHQIVLEITERDLMENESLAIDRLNNLRTIGMQISVDDYGIGQSSLSKLKNLPVNELKIDKSFILNLNESPADQDIVSSTISLGHKLGMRVVAEGVENEPSLNLLREMQCDYIQGYYLSKPVGADQLIEWMKSYEADS